MYSNDHPVDKLLNGDVPINNLIENIQSAEFQFLLSVFYNYEKSKKRYLRIITDRDFKLTNLLEIDSVDLNDLNKRFGNIEKIFNSVDITCPKFEILNVANSNIDEFNRVVGNICHQYKISFDEHEDLPF